jgi:hypothetical protein
MFRAVKPCPGEFCLSFCKLDSLRAPKIFTIVEPEFSQAYEKDCVT